MTTDPAEKAILQRLAACGPGKSISPEDAARALAGNPADGKWQSSLSPIRLAAQRLAKSGQIILLRKGKPVAPEDARGVIRLKLAAQQP